MRTWARGLGDQSEVGYNDRVASRLLPAYFHLHILATPCSTLFSFVIRLDVAFSMASKYAFTQGLRELRFLFCQTSDHSAATRYRKMQQYVMEHQLISL